MCGIAGIFAYSGESAPVDRAELLRVRERMHSRGPDGEGLWIADDQRVGLAHRRLAIIDLSNAGAQPMHDPETGNRIVFNGEIYNYQALRDELIAAGHRHSLEVRVPLVDLPLARTVARLSRASLPADKQAMADTPRRKLPADVLNHRKTGFSVPVRDWLAQRSDQPTLGQARGLRGWAQQLHRQQGLAVA